MSGFERGSKVALRFEVVRVDGPMTLVRNGLATFYVATDSLENGGAVPFPKALDTTLGEISGQLRFELAELERVLPRRVADGRLKPDVALLRLKLVGGAVSLVSLIEAQLAELGHAARWMTLAEIGKVLRRDAD